MITLSLTLCVLGAAPAFAVDTGDIVVASIRGEVHFVIGGTERTLRVGAALEPPATVRTGHDGAIELKQGATSVNVGPDTLLEFPALAERGGPIDRIVQPRGNAFYDVGKRPGRKLRVETPYLVGVVKGTQFNVAAQDAGATISLFEGLLEIHAADNDSVVDIKAGEVASRQRGDQNISVIKMDAKAPAAPRPAATPEKGSNPPPVNVEGDSFLAVRDSSERPIAGDVVETFNRVGDPGPALARGVSAAPVVINPAVDVPAGAAPPPAVANPGPVSTPVVSTPPVVITPPIVSAPPVVISPPVVSTPPVVNTPPAVSTPPVVDAPPVASSPLPPVVPVVPPVTVEVVGSTGGSTTTVDPTTTVGGVDLSTGVDLGLGTDVSGNSGNGNGNAGSNSHGNGTGNSGNGDNSNHGSEDDGVHGLTNQLLNKPAKK